MKLTLPQLKRHIKRCMRKHANFNFLGLVENKELTPEVERYFMLSGIGMSGYDWVKGNERLNKLIEEVKFDIMIQQGMLELKLYKKNKEAGK